MKVSLHLPTGFARMNLGERHAALADACLRASADAIETEYARVENAHSRTAYYLSAEFLTGRLVFSNLYNLGLLREAESLWKSAGKSLSELSEIPDPALGNGGLGRLAACFLDAAATHNYPLWGYGIRYRYGLFRQNLADGYQREEPDDWTRMGDPWSIRRTGESVLVPIADRRVRAVPYDIPIFGYGGGVTILRLFQAEAEAPFDFAAFENGAFEKAVAEKEWAERISMVLYPNDQTTDGRALRIAQEAFFTEAAIADLLRRHERTHGQSYSTLAEHAIFQLNDTHPVLAIPALIHALTERGVLFDDAFKTAQRMFAYTNHTVMAEALECWEQKLVLQIVPHLWHTIEQIDERLKAEYPSKKSLHILRDGRVHMANLASYVSCAINGVAKLHTEILRREVLHDWEAVYPGKIQNKTNGITPRRWLGVANPTLAACITERIGDGWITELEQLSRLKEYEKDPATLGALRRVKAENKEKLAQSIEHACGVSVDPAMLFDVQIKRLHEYKRQLMNAFSILHLYFDLKDGTISNLTPTAFLFGAKSAPGYKRAKGIIRFILQIAKKINGDPAVRDQMRVVFIPDYNVSWAEKMVAAGDISEQISMAGTEASGTGNMKFMLNGAPTLGTLDGANLEIRDAAGAENNFFFGPDAAEMRRRMQNYQPKKIYQADIKLARVIDTLTNGTFDDGGSGIFAELHNALLTEDRYCVLGDFADYLKAKKQALASYQEQEHWIRLSLANIAAAGRFSSDRTIAEYARDIWHI